MTRILVELELSGDPDEARSVVEYALDLGVLQEAINDAPDSLVVVESATAVFDINPIVEANAQARCVAALVAMGEATAARRLARHLAGVSTDLAVAVVAPFESLVGKQST